MNCPDIIPRICDQLDTGSAVSFALTHPRFLEAARNRIWYRITSIEPILSCLPQSAWALVKSESVPRGKYVLLRPLKEEDLKRYFEVYAPRIKVMALELYYHTVVPSTELLHALQLVTGYRPGALTPSLRRFEWICIDDSLTPFMSLFLGPQVQSLTLEDPDEDRSLSMTSLYSHTRGLPHLKELRLTGHPEDTWHSNYITSHSWDYLQDITLHFITPFIIRHLSTLPRLQRVNISDTEEYSESLLVEPPTPAEDQHFPSLRELDLEFVRIFHLGYFLRYLPVGHQIQTVRCRSWKPSSTSDYQGTIDTICRVCNPHSLKHLSLHEDPETHPELFRPPEGEEALDVDLGEPVGVTALCSFPLLETATVWLSKPLRLGSQDIERMAAAWPSMHRLDLCAPLPSFDRLPAIDHTHLLTLLRGCPSIRYLGLRFDATRIGETDEDGTFLLRTLRVGGSPICSPSRVVGFIKKHFPRLKELGDIADEDPEDDAELTMLKRRWDAVRCELRLERPLVELSNYLALMY